MARRAPAELPYSSRECLDAFWRCVSRPPRPDGGKRELSFTIKGVKHKTQGCGQPFPPPSIYLHVFGPTQSWNQTCNQKLFYFCCVFWNNAAFSDERRSHIRDPRQDICLCSEDGWHKKKKKKKVSIFPHNPHPSQIHVSKNIRGLSGRKEEDVMAVISLA